MKFRDGHLTEAEEWMKGVADKCRPHLSVIKSLNDTLQQKMNDPIVSLDGK